MKIGMEHWWNDSDKGKQKYFVRNKYHMDWHGFEAGPGRRRTV
jgi:hypothetical protein